MPELPEVEVAARNLRRWLEGRVIESGRIPTSRITRQKKLDVSGARVESVERRGKWLRLKLSTGTLFSHLGMTGKWVRRERDSPDEKYQKARLDLTDASIIYRDPRLFGRLLIVARDTIAEWDALGPDPLTDGLDGKIIAARLARTSRAIKETLLDQTIFAGVGNIQAAESLWRARIHPETRSSSLSVRQIAALVKAIDASIDFTLKLEDGPEIEYVEEPGAENPFKVYGKQGEPCPRCKTKLRRIVQAGRSTVFCPRCQAKRS